ncbi:MAG: WecB/TagA/CpsF family glycosyltransferase [Cyanobacteria bacterium HKST-UBA03]|nr:WecB/TagA/CpsF family glycosyltransferase [Cyanobacteria bacterium HKST-UBA03]
MLETARCKLEREFPNLKVGGYLSPPFRSLTDEEMGQIIDQIRDSGAQIVFVALGCPKQERWMAEHAHKLPAVSLGIGAALPVYAETLSRSPKWMQNYGLEWVYRLFQEPNRLLKRYAVTNTLFILNVLLQWCRLRLTVH